MLCSDNFTMYYTNFHVKIIFENILGDNSKKDFILIWPLCVSLYFKLRFVPKGPNLASVIEKKEILLIRMLELFNRLSSNIILIDSYELINFCFQTLDLLNLK